MTVIKNIVETRDVYDEKKRLLQIKSTCPNCKSKCYQDLEGLWVCNRCHIKYEAKEVDNSM